MVAPAASLAGPEHALESARLVVAWAHGFVSMELAGAFRLGGNVDTAFALGSIGSPLRSSGLPGSLALDPRGGRRTDALHGSIT